MNSRNLLAVAALLATLAPASAWAGAVAISEFGARASGRGYAVGAMSDDPSMVYYNPAAITRLSGMQLELGVSGLMPRWQYAPAGGAAVKSETSMVPPPSFSATYNFGDVGAGTLAAGLGFYVPFGSTFSWPTNWAGSEEVEKIALQVYELTPVIAWRPVDALALGVGLRYSPAQVYLKQGVVFPGGQNGMVELSGKGSAWGAHAGLEVWPMDGLSLGLTWRSALNLKATGQSHFAFAPPFDTSKQDADVSTTLPLAQMFRLGAAYDVTPDFNVSADVEYQLWDKFTELKIDFTNPDGTRSSASQLRNNKNSWVLHLGGEYRLSREWAVRAGYTWDQKTLPEETVNPAPPDSDKHVLAVGGSWFMSDAFALHAFFADALFTPRTTTTNALPGTWTGGWSAGSMAYMFGLSATANLDIGARADR